MAAFVPAAAFGSRSQLQHAQVVASASICRRPHADVSASSSGFHGEASSLRSVRFDASSPRRFFVHKSSGDHRREARADGARIRMAGRKGNDQPPPDLPSLLLNSRIVYLGMPLVPAVTELIIAQLLWLQYNEPQKPVIMYINSTGTSRADGETVGFETEAFAICDTMAYIKPQVHAICVGQAYGMAAMILACGTKGFRGSLPHATIMLNQPRTSAQGQATEIAIKAREAMSNRQLMLEILAEKTGQTVQKIEQDSSRSFYLAPEEAIGYGLIDRVLSPQELPRAVPMNV